MLILSRKLDEKIKIGDEITLTIIEIRGDQVKREGFPSRNFQRHSEPKPCRSRFHHKSLGHRKTTDGKIKVTLKQVYCKRRISSSFFYS